VRAVTQIFNGAVDLNDVARGDGYLFVRDGVGLAGRGIAAEVDADQALALLRTIEVDNQVGGAGTGPVAIGALPFLPGRPCRLIVPAVVVGKRADGTQWITTIDKEGVDNARESLVAVTPQPHGAEFSVKAMVPIDTYLAAVVHARDAVRAGLIEKAVIARNLLVSSNEPIDLHAVLLRLRASFGSSYRYSINGFVGASPELLIAVDGTTVRSHPLAGTTARTGDPVTDARLAEELLRSTKNQIEHRIVINEVHDTLLPWASYLDWEPEPSIVAVANVQHLGTRMEGQLSQPQPDALTLARALSPTPALGGYPRVEALGLIERVEGFERGNYGGAVGWIDAAGNGTWAVAIRCASFSPDRRSAVLMAGGGIVADSDPLSELAETQSKFQAMLSAIIRP
jgi:isochorismate synthase